MCHSRPCSAPWRARRAPSTPWRSRARRTRCRATGVSTSPHNTARDEEYEEIPDKCRDCHAETDKETAAGHFTYAELEDNDEDLTKLRGWFDKVSARDVLGAARRGEAESALEECATVLDGFADRVYAEDRD